jgi:hexosaminidase
MFPEIWVASSFKGSSGEVTTMSYIAHHQRNQQTWLETMYTASYRHRINFTGIAVTGWSRYDHMLSLCELLPSSIPSLAYALQTIVYGYINFQKNETISKSLLGCDQMPLWEQSAHATPVSCTFPGKTQQVYLRYCHVNKTFLPFVILLFQKSC